MMKNSATVYEMEIYIDGNPNIFSGLLLGTVGTLLKGAKILSVLHAPTTTPRPYYSGQ
jgi:hypothetical protein